MHGNYLTADAQNLRLQALFTHRLQVTELTESHRVKRHHSFKSNTQKSDNFSKTVNLQRIWAQSCVLKGGQFCRPYPGHSARLRCGDSSRQFPPTPTSWGPLPVSI